MFDSLLDALGMAGQAVSAPGDYLRGALAGKVGERASGRDLLSSVGLDPGEGTLGEIAGFGTEVATDPLTYAGAGLGRLLGGRASAAAAARGPRYATTADDLSGMLGRYAADAPELDQGAAFATRRAAEITKSPNAARILSELPPESSILGAGAEGMAFGTPTGDVVRLGRVWPDTPGRPLSQNVLQATRAIDTPNNAGSLFRAERLPMASNVDDLAGYAAREKALMRALGDEGLTLSDRGARNVGEVAGRPVVIDPGAVEPAATASRASLTGTNFPAAVGNQAVMKSAESGPLMSRLLAMLDADRATRTAVESGLAGPNFRPELTLAGGGLGSVGGAFGRATGGPR